MKVMNQSYYISHVILHAKGIRIDESKFLADQKTGTLEDKNKIKNKKVSKYSDLKRKHMCSRQFEA